MRLQKSPVHLPYKSAKEPYTSVKEPYTLATFLLRVVGWQRCKRCLKLQVSFRKRATNNRALLWKTTCKDKAPYESSPPCSRHHRVHLCAWVRHCATNNVCVYTFPNHQVCCKYTELPITYTFPHHQVHCKYTELPRSYTCPHNHAHCRYTALPVTYTFPHHQVHCKHTELRIKYTLSHY